MSERPNVIGLNGVARAGKDTVGGILRDLYGYEIKSFSDVLNKALIALNPWIDTEFYGWVRYADWEAEHGYERAKDTEEVRRLLQHLGTEVGRNLLGANIWVDALFKDYEPDSKWAIVNVRFPNEYDAVQNVGGEVWRIERPGFEPARGHVSDTALDNYTFDVTIQNDGTEQELAAKVMDLMERET